MHRIETIDYGIVLEGEILLIMDEGETTVRAGDIVMQRGTNHGWANRSGRNCRIALILIDSEFAPELKGQAGTHNRRPFMLPSRPGCPQLAGRTLTNPSAKAARIDPAPMIAATACSSSPA